MFSQPLSHDLSSFYLLVVGGLLFLKSHRTGQRAEVPDGGVGHGQVTGRDCVLPTASTVHWAACKWGDTCVSTVFQMRAYLGSLLPAGFPSSTCGADGLDLWRRHTAEGAEELQLSSTTSVLHHVWQRFRSAAHGALLRRLDFLSWMTQTQCQKTDTQN